MATNRRKQDDKNLETLRELILLNGNKYCLDCNQRGPTYVNTTIGSFVCSKCSGMLRGLTPPHRVKSISMATFTPEEIEFIKSRGNDYCRLVWLGLYESESVNFADEQCVKDFMSDKYEKKRYYLEPASDRTVSNGGSLSKSTSSIKNGNDVIPKLISVPMQSTKTLNKVNSTVNTPKVMNNFSLPVDTPHKISRPVNNTSLHVIKNTNASANAPSVPDFPVDFSTAEIYNGSHYTNNNLNNNYNSQPAPVPVFNSFHSTPSAANDRYAALADLDLALRQQNMKNMDDGNTLTNKNPFESSNANNIFANKNPFFNGGWSVPTAPVPVNPFMQTSNSGSITNSKNPFL